MSVYENFLPTISASLVPCLVVITSYRRHKPRKIGNSEEMFVFCLLEIYKNDVCSIEQFYQKTLHH